jgi:hypothetical protein
MIIMIFRARHCCDLFIISSLAACRHLVFDLDKQLSLFFTVHFAQVFSKTQYDYC